MQLIFNLILMLIIVFISIYYNKIKKETRLGEITFVKKRILYFIAKLRKSNSIGIVNIFTSKVHVLDESYFNNPQYNNFYRHELIHLKQIKYFGRIKYKKKYILYSLKYGYNKNPFELQAYKYENEFKDEQLEEEFKKGLEKIYINNKEEK